VQAEECLKAEFGEKYKKGLSAWIDLRGDTAKGYFQDNMNKNLDMLILQEELDRAG